MEKCDIIIPVWNELESTKECLQKLKDHTSYPYRLIIIDNGSDEPTKKYLESAKEYFSDFLLIRNDTNLGFVKAVNQGMVSSNNPYVCILNNDAFVTEKWLTFLIETIEIGPKEIGIANPTSNVFGKDSADGRAGEWQELDSCKGFCMLIKREVVEKIGLFDEVYEIGYFEEKDFCRRAIETGYICIRSKGSFVFHKDRLSFDKIKDREEIFKRNETVYSRKWGRSLNIAFISREKDCTRSDLGLIYKLLDKGHRIHIFCTKAKRPASLKDHIQIRYFSISKALFGYIVLFKLWERHHSKKVELVIAENENILKFFNTFKFIHRADVFNNINNNVLDFCKVKSKEG